MVNNKTVEFTFDSDKKCKTTFKKDPPLYKEGLGPSQKS